MQNIDWNKLGLKGESKESSFEDMCMYLFCRELGITEVQAYKNHPGIETEPVHISGKQYGFQAKFFSGKFDWSQVQKSVKKGIENYPDLDYIYVYSNKAKTNDSRTGKPTKGELELRALAKEKKIKLKYITDQGIKVLLQAPKYLDIAQLYFGMGEVFGFVSDGASVQKLNLINSCEYIELPITDVAKKAVSNLPKKILNNESRVSQVIGNPGSGKSILMQKLLQVYGGLNCQTRNKMQEVFEKNNAIPILIDLKLCNAESLKNIIFQRKSEYGLLRENYNYIYLLDGLDELDDYTAELALFHIHKLAESTNTKKIIISCRAGNSNRLKTRTYFSDVIEYKISELEIKYIEQFFSQNGKGERLGTLKALQKNNARLVSEINDIILVKLLWDTASFLHEDSTVFDLFEKKIKLLLGAPDHRKALDSLNLPNPKEGKIIEICQDIAYKYSNLFQFRFNIKDLQELLFKKFTRLDYASANKIIATIADLFFDISTSDNFHTSYIFKHRRYQELFFAQKLKNEYEKTPKALRESRIVSNLDFFENLFLKYIRADYSSKNNLIGLIELNLIERYLGIDNEWGIHEPTFIESSEFIPALVSQDEFVFNELFFDENLKLNSELSIDVARLELALHAWKKEKRSFWAENYIRTVFEDKMSRALMLAASLWQYDQKDIANDLLSAFNKAYKLISKSGYLKKVQALHYPHSKSFEEFIYIKSEIRGESLSTILKEIIRRSYKAPESIDLLYTESSGEFDTVSSFLRIALTYQKSDLIKLLDDLNSYEKLCLLYILKDPEYWPLFFRDNRLKAWVKKTTITFTEDAIKNNPFILFYKKLFRIKLTDREIKIANKVWTELSNRRDIDWSLYPNLFPGHALFSFILNKFSFSEALKEQEGHPFRYFSARELYCCLYNQFIELLKPRSKVSVEDILRNYKAYIDFYFKEVNYHYVRYNLTKLWVNIFSCDPRSENEVRRSLTNFIEISKEGINSSSFYSLFNRKNQTLCSFSIPRQTLLDFEDEYQSWDGNFYKYADHGFILARLYSKTDPQKAKAIFKRVINHTSLRHGWRKDTIISYQLIDSLEILWHENWSEPAQLKELTQRVFKLSLQVRKITDGKHTDKAPLYLIDLISKYDIEFAKHLQDKLIADGEHDSPWRFNSMNTSIILGKISTGASIEEINDDIDNFKQMYGGYGKATSDKLEQKFIVYIAIAESRLYTNEERKQAFENAHEQVQNMVNGEMEYYLADHEFKDHKVRFNKLCKKYKLDFKLNIKDQVDDSDKGSNENNYLRELSKCKTKKQLLGKYKKLQNYENNIVLSHPDSWKKLVEKTLLIYGNITPFIDYLKRNHYPATNYHTRNSQYMHFGLAYALSNTETEQEIMLYLSRNTGYQGAISLMKTYQFLNDRKSCIKLFDRFLSFCEFLSF